MTHEPVPQRLSDADRDAAVNALRQHYEAGRLSDEEFADRSGKALEARVASEADALFTDLPDPHPSLGSPAASPWADTSAWGQPQQPFDPGNRTWPTTQPNWPGAIPSSWTGNPQQYTPTPVPYESAPQPVRPDARHNWIAVGRKVVWSVVIVAALATGQWVGWVVMGIVATIVLSQIEGRTRKPPPY